MNDDFQKFLETTFVKHKPHHILKGNLVMVKAIQYPMLMSAEQAERLAEHLRKISQESS